MSQTKQEIRTWIADQFFIIIPASSIRKTSTEKKESFWKNGMYENGGEKKKKKNRSWGARDLQDININRWRLLEVSEVNGWLCNFSFWMLHRNVFNFAQRAFKMVITDRCVWSSFQHELGDISLKLPLFFLKSQRRGVAWAIWRGAGPVSGLWGLLTGGDDDDDDGENYMPAPRDWTTEEESISTMCRPDFYWKKLLEHKGTFYTFTSFLILPPSLTLILICFTEFVISWPLFACSAFLCKPPTIHNWWLMLVWLLLIWPGHCHVGHYFRVTFVNLARGDYL